MLRLALHRAGTTPSLRWLGSLVQGIDETHLEERFVRGSGPGGQSVNKTRNKVQLLHLPTGLRVESQQTRDLTSNRIIARKVLLGKLERLSLGEESRAAKRERRLQRRKYNARRCSLLCCLPLSSLLCQTGEEEVRLGSGDVGGGGRGSR